MLCHRQLMVASLLGAAVLVGSAFGSPGSPGGQRTTPAAQGERRRVEKYVPGQLLVRFRRGIKKQAMRAEHALVRAEVLKEFRVVENLQLVRLPAGMPVKEAERYYRARPDVLYAEPDYILHAIQTPVTPNDPYYREMWSLHNTGQSGGTPGADMHAAEAWGLTTGSSDVVVAVVDTGIDYNHADLAANIWSNPATTTLTLNGMSVTCGAGTHGFNALTMSCDPLDDYSHGTHVAGTIGASGNNGIGVVGVNWQVRLMGCKFLDASGSGTSSGAITCMEYLAMMKDSGVNLLATNNSWGGGGFSQAMMDAIDSHRRRGMLFIAAAGNSGAKTDLIPVYPANYNLPNVIAVAATDRSDALTSWSNFGRYTIHLAAPGNEILSTVIGSDYAVFSGTSMAAPHVTGVAALLKAQDPARDWKAIKNLILAGGDTIPAAANTITQKRLNAYGALTCSDSVLQRRLWPIGDDAYAWAGDSLKFVVLDINCAAPNGPLPVLVDGGPETIILADDGHGPDLEAADGVYVAQRQWLASEVGDHTLTFPNNDVVTVHVVPPLAGYTYSTAVPYAYRVIEGTTLSLGDDDGATIRPPFPIQFGGVGFPTLNVNSNGNVTFFAPFVDWENSPLPVPGTPALVAPFWDDLYTDPLIYKGSSVGWEVTGSAPNRELVIEWRAGAMRCIFSELPSYPAKFQIVFFEGSSDILFNYADVRLGSYDPGNIFRGCAEEVQAGASATVGVQSMGSVANQFSFNTASLTNNSSILWQIGQPTPAITRLSPFAVLVGSAGFALQVRGRSFVPGSVLRWNGNDLPTTFVNAGELTANIGAGEVAAAGTAQVTVFNPPPYGSRESAPAEFQIYSSYPAPRLAAVAPNPVPLQIATSSYMGASIIVTLTGSQFVPNSVARWNGRDLATTVVSSTELGATVTFDGMALGTAEVTVFNPAPGGGISNVLTVSVVNPAPVLNYTVPSVVGAGAPGFTLQVSCSPCMPTSVVRWNGNDRSTQFSGVLAAAIPATDVASLGTAQVTVFTPPPGGGTSDPLTLSIVAPPANDKFANASVISTFPFTLTESTAGATTDPLDPKPPCVLSPPAVQESVWFSFTPPAAGAFVNVYTSASNYPHILSAWTGSPGNLANVACGFWGRVTLVAASTSPIYFMVSESHMGSTGTLVFNLNVQPGFTLAANPTTNTVQLGSSATYTITVNPQWGSFDDRIRLSCSVVPTGPPPHGPSVPPLPTCSLSPSAVTPGSAPVSVTLTVVTTNVARLEKPGEPAPFLALWLALPALGLVVGGRILSGANKAALGIFLALVLIGALLALDACGGGGGGGGGTPPPLRGTATFNVVVTGTSGTISQQTLLSLTESWSQ